MEVRMGNYIPREDLLKRIPSKYQLVIIGAERARKIKEGSKVLVERENNDNEILLALKEIKEGKLKIEKLEKKGD
jgi:DNA-directed RNA polymerase subunit omega